MAQVSRSALPHFQFATENLVSSIKKTVNQLGPDIIAIEESLARGRMSWRAALSSLEIMQSNLGKDYSLIRHLNAVR